MTNCNHSFKYVDIPNGEDGHYCALCGINEDRIKKTEHNPRVIATDPWNSIDKSLDLLIDKIIIEANPSIIDDHIPDLLDDWDNRVMAIEVIENKLKQLKGE